MQNRQHISIKPGIVLAVNEDGTYKVLPATGRETGIPIDGIRPVIPATLQAGDKIVLFWERAGEPPRILVTGAGGSTCSVSVNSFGVHFG